MDKDALYLEVDEDITSAIDKLKNTPGSSVSIVVPKRSTMLQSIINLKLLQKAAKTAGKQLVLVTNDRVATELAGRVGLAVAETLGGKAAMPVVAAPVAATADEVIDESTDFGDTAALSEATAPVVPVVAPPTKPGTAAKKAPATPVIARRELADDTPEATTAAVAETAIAADDRASAKAKDPKVPDFTKLQKRLMWAGAAVALVVAYFVLMYFYTSAHITLYAAGTQTPVTVNISADPSLTKSDIASGALAAQQVKVEKDLTNTFVPSGQKDVGTQATGQITVTNNHGGFQGLTLQAGTRFVAPDGKVFRSNSDATIPPATLDFSLHVIPGTQKVAVTADQNGDSYNEAAGQVYTIPALNDPQVTAKGDQMSGGTSKIVKIVTQADIDQAKAALLASDKASQKDLDAKVPSGFMAITGSFAQAPAAATSTPGVGEPADQGSITFHVVDTELAVSKSDYHAAVLAQETKALPASYTVYSDGLASATITPGNRDANGRQSFQVAVTVAGGPQINTSQLAKSLTGKRYSDATDSLSKLSGVQRSDIAIWPSWQANLPARASKIQVSVKVVTSGG